MTHQRLCGPQRQPCPNPYLCGTDCDYQTSETPLIQKNSDGSNPGYMHTILDAAPNAWDDAGFIKRCFVVFGAVLACMLVAAVVVGALR